MRPEAVWRSIRGALALLVATLMAPGCANDGERKESFIPPDPPLRVDSLLMTARAGVNANRPVRATLVRVQDVRLIIELMQIENSAWFGSAGEAFRRKYPEAYYDDWELVPGHVAGPFGAAVNADVAGVFFCDVRVGSPPLRVERDGDVTVEITDTDCILGGGRLSHASSETGDSSLLERIMWFPMEFLW